MTNKKHLFRHLTEGSGIEKRKNHWMEAKAALVNEKCFANDKEHPGFLNHQKKTNRWTQRRSWSLLLSHQRRTNEEIEQA